VTVTAVAVRPRLRQPCCIGGLLPLLLLLLLLPTSRRQPALRFVRAIAHKVKFATIPHLSLLHRPLGEPGRLASRSAAGTALVGASRCVRGCRNRGPPPVQERSRWILQGWQQRATTGRMAGKAVHRCRLLWMS
jgi:hypothetical protein